MPCAIVHFVPFFARAGRLLRETASQWVDDKCPRLAAALAYYTVFAMAPLLLVVVAAAGAIWGADAARSAVVSQIGGLVGPDGMRLVDDALSAAAHAGNGWVAAALGTVGVLVAATGVFAELQGALNTVWGLESPKGKPILRAMRERALSLAMVLALGFLLLVSLVISAALAAISSLGSTDAVAVRVVLALANSIASFGVTFALVAAIYKVLPDARIQWKEVWLGAAITALMLTLGKAAIGAYLGRGALTSAFGAAGSLAALLAWVYYAGLIFFFGAEFTEVYADRQGAIETRRGAVRMEKRRVRGRRSRSPDEPPVAANSR